MADGSITFKITVDNKGAITSIDQVEKAAQEVGASSERAQSHIAGIGIAAGIAQAAAQKAFQAIASSMDAAISRADTLQNFSLVMSNMGVGVDEANEAIKRLDEGIQGLPTTLDAAASGVKRLTSSNGDINKSTEMFLAMNDAIVAGGAPMELQTAALEQLTQAYSKGKPDMIEWRSILNAMPAQMMQIASSFGMTTEEMGTALRNGTLSMDDFMEAVVRLDKEGTGEFASFAEQAQNATATIGVAITNMKTAITRNLANVLAAMNENGELTGFFESMRNAIDKVGAAIVAAIPTIMNILNWLKQFAPVILMVVSAMAAFMIVQKVNALIDALKISMAALNAVMAANPIGIVIALIAALVAGIIYLWNTNEDFRNAVTSAWEKIKEVATTVFQAIANFFTVTVPNAIQTFLGWIASIPSRMLELGKNIVSGIVKGITSAPQAVFNALKNMVFGAVDRIKSWLGISSPSKYMADQIGQWLPEGLAVGITANTDSVEKAMQGLSNAVTGYDFGLSGPDYSPTSSVTYSSSLNAGSIVGEIRSLRGAIENLKVYLDTNALVGGIAPQMDSALGRLEMVGAR